MIELKTLGVAFLDMLTSIEYLPDLKTNGQP